ncbi:MAG: sodium/proton antiporter NhaA [Wolinella sp.]
MTKSQDLVEKSGIKDLIFSFIKSESFSGIFLFTCAVVAMIIANSPLAESYFHLWHVSMGITIGETFVGMSLHHWINDVLMSFFFLMVGLEIKRELLFGELAGIKRAAFPAIAALGGMIAPGIIYSIFNIGTSSSHGFGIPMATDIAFALGVILMLGDRVSLALKVFLVSLAVVDDLGAVVVIAIFYTDGLQIAWLLASVAILGGLIGLNKIGVRSLLPYAILGILLWITVHNCGVHATIAAVALAFTIPVKPKIETVNFAKEASELLERFLNYDKERENVLLASEQLHSVENLTKHSKSVQSPLVRLEHALSPWSAYVIMPLFAFANAGVAISSNINLNIDGVLPGIMLGLIVGKPIGILGLTYISEKIGIAARPQGVMWIDVLGAGMLAGIGFTMSIFITNLAFTNPEATDVAKISILTASLLAGVFGSIFLIIRSKIIRKKSCCKA